jgi:hypothetical protein
MACRRVLSSTPLLVRVRKLVETAGNTEVKVCFGWHGNVITGHFLGPLFQFSAIMSQYIQGDGCLPQVLPQEQSMYVCMYVYVHYKSVRTSVDKSFIIKTHKND